MTTIAPRKRPGRWKAGESGNPAGRKPGAGEVAKMRADMAAHVPALVAVLVARALDGDTGAARLLLERTVAPLKASEEVVPLTLPDGSLTDQGKAVLRAVANGHIAPGQGAALVGAIGTLARVAEVDELERRIMALEARNEPKEDQP
jgi:hypothetical protein